MDLKLAGKIALVTGAGSGIGREIALALAREGSTVLVGDINAEAAQRVASEIKRFSADSSAVALDVSDESACVRAVRETTERYGSLDILVNNAGICPFSDLAEIDAEEWDKVLQVNLRGAFVLSREVLPTMMRQRWGRIVNVSSMAGKVGGLAVAAHYSASKAGLICLTKTLARSGAKYGVTANAVAPAFIRTPLFTEDELRSQAERIPVGRVGEADEVADAVLFLASESAGFITGMTLDINGGMLMD